MKKALLLAGVACLYATGANAVNISPYVGAKIRYSMIESDFDVEGGDQFDVDDKVFGGSLSIGMKTNIIGGAIRAELEYNKNADAEKKYWVYYENNTGDIDEGEGTFKLKTQSLMLNGYFDVNTGTKITPYIGAGIGYTKMKGELRVNGEKGSQDDETFAWQLGAGIGYAINNNVSIDAGYRYVDYGDFEDDGDKIDTSSHELYIGIRYNF